MNEYLSFVTADLRAGAVIIFACLVMICVACLLDLWTGIDAARAAHERIRSKPLRKTGVKIGDYFRLVMFFLLVDLLGLCFPWYGMPYAVIMGTAGVLFVEGFSMVENLRKKKSHAAEVVDFAAKIVECLTPEEAHKLIEKIRKDDPPLPSLKGRE